MRLGNYLEIVLVFKDVKVYKLNINKYNVIFEFFLFYKKKFVGYEMFLFGWFFLLRDWYVGIYFFVKFVCLDWFDIVEEMLNFDWKFCLGLF